MRQTLILAIILIFKLNLSAQTESMIIDNSFSDTNKYAVLSYQDLKPWQIDSSSIDAAISSEEIKLLDKLFHYAVSKYNEESSNRIDSFDISNSDKTNLKNETLLDLKRQFYFKQIFPVLDKNGDKIIWINCFKANQNQLDDIPKFYLIDIADGLNEYFNLFINLSRQTTYGMTINAGG